MIKAGPVGDVAEKVDHWISDGCNASLSWIERNKELRYDPRLLLDGRGQTMVVCGLSYQTLDSLKNHPVASYAHFTDYHHTVKHLLKCLHQDIEKHTLAAIESRQFCDSAPILERYWAVKAGLGWIGKNSMVINRDIGSYFFIGILLLARPYDKYDSQSDYDGCANCNRCTNICLSNAIRHDRSVDCRKCLSYITIENRGDYTLEQEQIIKQWRGKIFGCDSCIAVCPWNKKSLKNIYECSNTARKKLLNYTILEREISYWQGLDKPTFKKLYSKLPITRAGYEKIKKTVTLL